MDSLSQFLEVAEVRGSIFCRAELGAPWGVSTRGMVGAVFHVVVRGSAHLLVEGKRPIALRSGDLVVLPHGSPHVLADQPETRPAHIASLPTTVGPDGLPCVTHGGDGPHTSIICGTFRFSDEANECLRPLLPQVIHVAGGSAAGWLDTTLRVLADELDGARPGSHLLVSRLADMIFVQILRTWAAAEEAGWLGALSDPHLARALGAIYGEPQRAWTATDLARRAGLSRSAFYTRFQQRVGEPPSAYLTRWRMILARRELRSGARMAAIADRVGYGSEAAFSRAFKRQVGVSPSAWRRERIATP